MTNTRMSLRALHKSRTILQQWLLQHMTDSAEPPSYEYQEILKRGAIDTYQRLMVIEYLIAHYDEIIQGGTS